jgi:hypothetical protein
MSVSPTDDALIVALDFEGEPNATGPEKKIIEYYINLDQHQAYTVSSIRLRRIHFLFSSIQLFQIS